MPFHIALVGNPNCGKTTLFNAVTGSSQYVGNWPGVTVEKKEGKFKHSGMEVAMVDLPGIYSLSPYTPEEIVSRNYIIEDRPDLIINIVDASNLERNLYLTTQIAELGRPMIIALNMIDMLPSLKMEIDIKLLEEQLGIPICPISASKSKGVSQLIHRSMHILHDIAHNEVVDHNGTFKSRAEILHKELHLLHNDFHDSAPFHHIVKHFYPWEISSVVEAIEEIISDIPQSRGALRFHAVKLFEGDELTLSTLQLSDEKLKIINEIKSSISENELVDHQMMVADGRYKYICSICEKTVKKQSRDKLTISDKIDLVLTNRFLAIPFFLAIMLLIFFITFGPIGTYLSDLLDTFINTTFSNTLSNFLVSANVTDWAISLLIDGMLAGVGGVLTFLPQIALLFFCLSILEGSGYMSRAAFIMDRPLRKIGLSGRSFVPMLMGFGCTVPAVMATRTLENERDKRLTVLLTPFMSCSAKMPVYVLFISAFFAKSKPLIIFSIYLLGILLAVLTGFIAKKIAAKTHVTSFVMELPSYRIPTLRGLIIQVWERIRDFLLKAGTILLAASVIVWFLQSFDFSLNMVSDSSKSILAMLGTLIAPIFAPLGFGFWQASVALLSGIVAKETVVTTFSILFLASDEAAQISALSTVFTPLSAFSFLTFVLIYIPCFAATAAIAREMRSFKWTIGTIFLQLSVAWVVSFLVFQIGRMVGLG